MPQRSFSPRLIRLIRAAAADRAAILQAWRTNQPVPAHIRFFRFAPGTFDAPNRPPQSPPAE